MESYGYHFSFLFVDNLISCANSLFTMIQIHIYLFIRQKPIQRYIAHQHTPIISFVWIPSICEFCYIATKTRDPFALSIWLLGTNHLVRTGIFVMLNKHGLGFRSQILKAIIKILFMSAF